MCIASSQLGSGAGSGVDSVLQQNADGTRSWVTSSSVGSGITQLTGDVTAGPGSGSQAATLASSGVTAATYGDSTHVAQVTFDAKGRATGASSVAISFPTRTLVFGIVVDGNGSAITTGVKGFVRIPVACTISKVTVLSIDAAATAGSIVFDVWKDTYANYPPTVADTITASAKPTLSSANKAEDATLTGWTKSVSAGDVIGFNVDSASTVTKVLLEVEATL